MNDFAPPPKIPPEIWEELAKLETFRKALEVLIGADLPRLEPSAHARTLKGIEDARQERQK